MAGKNLKKLGQTANKTWKYAKSYLPFSFIGVTNVSYSVLCNHMFVYYCYASYVAVQFWDRFEFQEKVIGQFKSTQNKFFKSQKLLQLFKLGRKNKPLKNPTVLIFNKIKGDIYCISQQTNKQKPTKLFEFLNHFLV